MNVNTSSLGPMETFVITPELRADKTTVYGFCPPSIVSPHGSHVVSVSVKLGCTDASEFELGGVYRHDVSLPAGRVSQYAPSRGDRRHGQCSPVTLYRLGGMPPVLPFESIIDSINAERGLNTGKIMAMDLAERWRTPFVRDLPGQL